jgi:hypothetical protein
MLNDFEKLKIVYLASNPFRCDYCGFETFRSFVTNHSEVFVDVADWVCDSPLYDRGFQVMLVDSPSDECGTTSSSTLTWFIVGLSAGLFLIAVVLVVLCYRYKTYFTYLRYVLKMRMSKAKEEELGEAFKYDAFVSYSSGDREWVLAELMPNLEGIRVVKDDEIQFTELKNPLHLCLHERDFIPGEFIMNNIIESLESSHRAIFVISNNFIDSQWCQWELQMASHKLFQSGWNMLILICLEPIPKTKIPKALNRLLQTKTYMEWSQNPNERQLFWARLRDAIGACRCGKQFGDLRNILRGDSSI